MPDNRSRQLQDRAIKMLAAFFKAEWSGALLAIVILAVAIEFVTTGKPFFHPSNLMTILNNSAAVGVIAGGMTLVILIAGIDLSVGSVMGMTGALAGYVVSFWGFSPEMAIMTGIGLGVSIGLFNGVLIAYWKMPAFIVTLAGLSIWRGVGHLATGAKATPELPPEIDYFGRFNPLSGLRQGFKDQTLPEFLMPFGRWLDANWLEYFRTFQMSMIIFVVFFIILALIIDNTRYGRYIYAIGSNEAGARQAGINTSAYKLMTYVFCSAAAAFGGLLFLGRAPFAKSDYGQAWELDAIAAVVIGGTSLFGGRGTLMGTFMGVILLKLIRNGLTLAQLNTFWQMVVTGLIILIAVGIDIVRQSRDPEAVRKLLAAISAAMAFFVFLTPGAVLMRAWIVIHESNSASALRASGISLASSQSERLRTPLELETMAQLISANLWPSVAFFILACLTLALIWRKHQITTLGFAGLFLVLIPVLLGLGYSAAAPFLVLGAVTLLASTIIDYLFERARELDANAGD